MSRRCGCPSVTGALTLALALLAGAATAVRAQTVTLDTFDAADRTGSVREFTSWVGNVTQNATSITVGGTARDENGWGAIGRNIDATGLKYLTVAARRDAGHEAPFIVVQFEDAQLRTQVIALNAADFSTGAITSVSYLLPAWPAEFDATRITGWSIGGGTAGISAFRVTFERLLLSVELPVSVHSADTDRNFRISLFELTRVIELFNTRNGATRTGAYAVATVATEDGFAPAPTRAVGVTAVLETYHSADTNRDGRLSLFELTRVIELFNYRAGATRTGQYHAEPGSEDGFAAGP
jgi:hypothetical protein